MEQRVSCQLCQINYEASLIFTNKFCSHQWCFKCIGILGVPFKTQKCYQCESNVDVAEVEIFYANCLSQVCFVLGDQFMKQKLNQLDSLNLARDKYQFNETEIMQMIKKNLTNLRDNYLKDYKIHKELISHQTREIISKIGSSLEEWRMRLISEWSNLGSDFEQIIQLNENIQTYEDISNLNLDTIRLLLSKQLSQQWVEAIEKQSIIIKSEILQSLSTIDSRFKKTIDKEIQRMLKIMNEKPNNQSAMSQPQTQPTQEPILKSKRKKKIKPNVQPSPNNLQCQTETNALNQEVGLEENQDFIGLKPLKGYAQHQHQPLKNEKSNEPILTIGSQQQNFEVLKNSEGTRPLRGYAQEQFQIKNEPPQTKESKGRPNFIDQMRSFHKQKLEKEVIVIQEYTQQNNLKEESVTFLNQNQKIIDQDLRLQQNPPFQQPNKKAKVQNNQIKNPIRPSPVQQPQQKVQKKKNKKQNSNSNLGYSNEVGDFSIVLSQLMVQTTWEQISLNFKGDRNNMDLLKLVEICDHIKFCKNLAQLNVDFRYNFYIQ